MIDTNIASAEQHKLTPEEPEGIFEPEPPLDQAAGPRRAGGRNSIGIERDPTHYATACDRLDRECRQGVLNL